MISYKDLITDHIRWRVGDGTSISLLDDLWLEIGPLRLFCNDNRCEPLFVSSLITNGNWDMYKLVNLFPQDIYSA